MKKMIFKNIMIFFGDTIFFSSPTDDLRGNPTKDSICSESFICHRDKRTIDVMRQVQHFIRLSMIL